MTLTAYISILFFVHFETIFKRSKGPRTVYDELKKEKSDPQILNPATIIYKMDAPATIIYKMDAPATIIYKMACSRNDYIQILTRPQRLYTNLDPPATIIYKSCPLPQRLNTNDQRFLISEFFQSLFKSFPH